MLDSTIYGCDVVGVVVVVAIAAAEEQDCDQTDESHEQASEIHVSHLVHRPKLIESVGVV